MTTVKCPHCGAERDLTYQQIEIVNREQRKCPACSIGTEQIVVKETRFQPFAEHLEANKPAPAVPAEISDTASSESEEPETDESPGIEVGPGGSVTRRRKQHRR